MFSFGADGMGYISLTDSVHSLHRTPPLPSLHQLLSLSLYPSLSSVISLSLLLPTCLYFTFILKDTTDRRSVITHNEGNGTEM